MAIISGWYALGTGVSNVGAFQECTGYTRPAVSFTGTSLSGLTQSVSQITAPSGPTGGVITKGAIFDSLTGGNCLMYWDWATVGAVGTNFPAFTANIIFNTYLQAALNMAATGGAGTTGSLLDAGAQIGTFNGQPLIASPRLSIGAGGSLIPHLGGGQWIGTLDVQNTASFGGLAATNIVDNLTALASGGQTGATLLTGFVNRVTTVANAADSVLLPSPSQGAPVGTMVMVTNAAASNAMAVFPDVGALINIGSANASLSVAAGKSVLFVRVGSLKWFGILSA